MNTHAKAALVLSTQEGTETQGMLLGLLAVAGFSLTLPMTRLAVAALDPGFVGLGRALIAAALAGIVLIYKRERLPARRHFASFFLVSFGVVIGFPFFSALAMRTVPASHGAILTALLPLSTAIFAVLRAQERPSPQFWIASLLGAGGVAGFMASSQAVQFGRGDVYLLLGVLTCGLGYAEGGRLARELGGWRVISWALVFTAPLLIIPVAFFSRLGLHASPAAWWGFLYLGVVSMFLAFCAWYAGMGLGGVARVSQIQLLQPFFTLLFSSVFLGEEITPRLLAFALGVVATVAVARRAPVLRRV